MSGSESESDERMQQQETVGGCCVCADDRGWVDNPLVFCDGPSCNIAVHKACYGIVQVPETNWYCRMCDSTVDKTAEMKCELCPSTTGALKPTDDKRWAHVICALYIPGTDWGNTATMEPILLGSINRAIFEKECYICIKKNRSDVATSGACISCNKCTCWLAFHVTCGQEEGLLCEETGYVKLKNRGVQYCGYCHEHLNKLEKTIGRKVIPPFPAAILSPKDPLNVQSNQPPAPAMQPINDAFGVDASPPNLNADASAATPLSADMPILEPMTPKEEGKPKASADIASSVTSSLKRKGLTTLDDVLSTPKTVSNNRRIVVTDKTNSDADQLQCANENTPKQGMGQEGDEVMTSKRPRFKLNLKPLDLDKDVSAKKMEPVCKIIDKTSITTSVVSKPAVYGKGLTPTKTTTVSPLSLFKQGNVSGSQLKKLPNTPIRMNQPKTTNPRLHIDLTDDIPANNSKSPILITITSESKIRDKPKHNSLIQPKNRPGDFR